MTQVTWEGIAQINVKIARYGQDVQHAVRQVATYYMPIVENYAKQNASWTDQTANARQSLHAHVENIAEETVALYLSHGVEYGIHLETKFSGKYAILWKTLQTHIPEIEQMLRQIFNPPRQ